MIIDQSAELSKQVEQLKLLHNIGLEIVSAYDIDKLLSLVVQQTILVLGYESIRIFLLERERLTLKATSCDSNESSGTEVEIVEGIICRCAKSKKIIHVRDTSRCSFYIGLRSKKVQSEIAAPIIFGTKFLGVVTLQSNRKNAFSEEDETILSILCAQMGVAIRNIGNFADLKKMASTDGLTNLYNYRYFRDRLDEEILRARRYGRDLSLILVDLDNFKKVNDIHGHFKGDEILISVSHLITQNTRCIDKTIIMKNVETEIAVRYGGDEFMIILPETSFQGAFVVADRMRKLIKKKINQLIPYVENENERFMITGSIGVGSLKPDESVDEFIIRVDKAMYEAKEKGKDQVCSGD